MSTKWKPPFWVGEQLIRPQDLDLIIWTVNRFPKLSRTELAQTICENLDWKAPNDKTRFHSCLDLLEKLAEDGILQLPQKRQLSPYKNMLPIDTNEYAKGIKISDEEMAELDIDCAVFHGEWQYTIAPRIS